MIQIRPPRCRECRSYNSQCVRISNSRKCRRCLNRRKDCIWPEQRGPSCVPCSKEKKRCDRNSPTCSRCRKRGKECKRPKTSSGERESGETELEKSNPVGHVGPIIPNRVQSISSTISNAPATQLIQDQFQPSHFLGSSRPLEVSDGQFTRQPTLLESSALVALSSASIINHPTSLERCHLPPFSSILKGRELDLHSGLYSEICKPPYLFLC